MWREFGDRKISRRTEGPEGDFCRSPNSLRMGFTFLMDANTSKYFYNCFMGMKQTLISHWKILKISRIERLTLSFPDTFNIFVYIHFISMEADPCSHRVVVKVLGVCALWWDESCVSSSRVINTNCHAIKRSWTRNLLTSPLLQTAEEVSIWKWNRWLHKGLKNDVWCHL